MFDNLTEENIALFSIKAYDTPNCIMSEFDSDFRRIKYIKRLFNRYKKTGKLNERLVLNHLIVLYNVFGPLATTRILFFKVDLECYDILKTFLLYLGRLPEIIIGINGKNINTTEIEVDFKAWEILKII